MMYHYCSYANGLLFVLLCALSLLCRVVQKRKKKKMWAFFLEGDWRNDLFL